jgi:hypothetical protein
MCCYACNHVCYYVLIFVTMSLSSARLPVTVCDNVRMCFHVLLFVTIWCYVLLCV